MKKWICGLLAAVMLLLCAGCSLPDIGSLTLPKKYAAYIQATMDCSFLGETENYLKEVEATQSEADEVYQNTVEGYASLIMYHFEVKEDQVSDDVIDAFRKKAADVMKGASYTVADAVKNSDGDYSVTVSIRPIDLMENLSYQPIVDWYNETYSADALSAMSEEEYAAVEEAYAGKILELLDTYTVAYLDEIKTTVTILVDDDGMYGLSDADWDSLDESVLGL